MVPGGARRRGRVDDIVIFGAGRMGTTIARVLLERGMRVRIVDAQRERAREVAEALPGRARASTPTRSTRSSSSASGSGGPPPRCSA